MPALSPSSPWSIPARELLEALGSGPAGLGLYVLAVEVTKRFFHRQSRRGA